MRLEVCNTPWISLRLEGDNHEERSVAIIEGAICEIDYFNLKMFYIQ